MNRDLIFLAGEYTVSAPLVYQRDRWAHTNIARKLVRNEDGTFCRRGINENLRGGIYYAGVSDDDIRRSNLSMFINGDFPCWPDPWKMIELDNRHIVMRKCLEAGFGTHDVFVGTRSEFRRHEMPWQFVLKTGNEHQGQGKHLLNAHEHDTPDWEGLATAEPFFEGDSVRILLIENDIIALRFTNPESWIKNSSGADVEQIPYVKGGALVAHATGLQELFEADICGCDYIIEKDGTFRFLEYNHFPGVGACDDAVQAASRLFRKKMDEVERKAA